MSLVAKAFGSKLLTGLAGPWVGRQVGIGPKPVPPAPSVPNPNDAANAAQNITDEMRMRRGLMANIYAGNNPNAGIPVTGKTQLGT